MDSLLSLLQKEDSLIRERDTNFNTYVSDMHTVDDFYTFGRYGTKTKEDISSLEKEIEKRKVRETEIDHELVNIRKSIVRYMLKLLER